MFIEEMRVEFADSALDLWLPALAVLAVILIFVWYRKRSLPTLIFSAIFGLYLLVAIQKLFFPIWVSGSFADAMRQERAFASFINLRPFYFGPFSSLTDALPTLLQNIALTIPFGFSLNFLVWIKAKHIFWLALAVGIGLEALQLLISLLVGYPYRFIDINDVLMNALGVVIGYGVFRIFAWLYRLAAPRFGIIGQTAIGDHEEKIG